MHEWQTQSHVRWECKYHVVISKIGACLSKAWRNIYKPLPLLMRRREWIRLKHSRD